MGGVTNPPASGPPSFTAVAGSGGNVNFQHNMAVSQQVTGATILGTQGTTVLNAVAGGAIGSAVFSGFFGFGRVDSVMGSGTVASAGWASIGSYQPFSVGGGGAVNGPNMGGFTCSIYAGIGDHYDATANVAFFIGLTSTLGNVTTQYSTTLNDAMGIIIDSTAASGLSTWSWITKRGAGAASITSLGVAATLHQLFAVGFSCGPNTDAIVMQVKQLTAAGIWTTLLSPTSLTGVGAALGTRVGPAILGRQFVAAGGGNNITFHRMVGICDQFTVPNAFPSL